MFYKIGFFVLLAVLIAGGWIFMRANPMRITGAAGWAEMYSENPDATLAFLKDTFGIRVVESKEIPGGMKYNVIQAAGQMWPFAGVMGLPKMANGKPIAPQSMLYLTVKDYEVMSKKLVAAGAIERGPGAVAGGMKFNVYTIPGGVTIGIAQYGVKK